MARSKVKHAGAGLALSAVLFAALPSFAQQAPPAGAQRIAHAYVVTSGVLPGVIGALKTTYAPKFKEAALGNPAVAGLPQAQQAKLSAFLDGLPNLVEDEAALATPAIETQMATSIAERFSAEEADGVATYFETPSGGALLRKITAAAIEANRTGASTTVAMAGVLQSLPQDEQKAFFAFVQSPGGVAFTRESKRLSKALESATKEVMSPRLKDRLTRDLCAQVGPPLCVGGVN